MNLVSTWNSSKNFFAEQDLIDLKAKNKGNKRVLKISGDMTAVHAEAIRASLVQSFNKADEVAVDLKKVAKVDIVALQLLFSAHFTAKNLGKFFTIAKNWSDAVGDTVENSGFASHFDVLVADHKSKNNLGGI
jgi:anti-anti-sigma factor